MTERPSGPGTAFATFLYDFLPQTELTNERIAEEMGYKGANIVSMWKYGRTKVTLDAVWRLSKLLNVDPAYLLALYFEQYVGEELNSAEALGEIIQMMGRVCTKEEWDIIQAVRQARKSNSFPAKAGQLAEVKKIFKVDSSVPDGPLRDLELDFHTSGDRRTFSRRGRDTSVSEAEDAASRNAETGGGTLRKSGSRSKR